MKTVTSKVEFDFKHNGTITVHVGPVPIIVDDEIADHLVSVFGGRIIVSDETPVATPEVVTPTSQEEVPAVASPETEASAEESVPETGSEESAS